MRGRVHVGLIAVVLVVLVVLAACGTTTLSTQSVVNPDVGVTSKNISALRLNEAPYLLVDRFHPNRVYMSEMDLQQRVCRFYFSNDRGATWTEGTAPSLQPYTDCGIGTTQPQNVRTELAQGPTGTLYYAYQANDDTATTTTGTAVGVPRSVLVGRSTDGGNTWTTVAVDASPKPSVPADVQANMEIHIAVDQDHPQNVYAMWRRSYPSVTGVTSRPTRPWMAVSTDGGATFGTPFQAPAAIANGFDGPRPVVVDGKVYAFYRVSAPAAVPGQATPPVTTLDVSISSDQGQTWQAPVQIDAARDASEPVPTWDATRKEFDVVYHDNNVVGQGTGHLNIYFTTSKDGIHWSTPTLLNDDNPGENLIQHFYPQISIAPGGRIDVAWYDFRDDPYPAPTPTGNAPLSLSGSGIGHDQAVYMTESRDGGKTWSKNIRLNSVPIDRTKGTWNGEFFFVTPPTVAAGTNFTVAAWSDTRNGDAQKQYQDIYTDEVTYGLPADAPPPPADNTGLVAVIAVICGVLIGAGVALLGVAATQRRRKEGVAVH